MRIFFLLAALTMISCAPDAERARPAAPSGPHVAAVSALMNAFNDHDADKMRQYWHEDVAWIEINGKQSSVVTNSAEQLYQELIVYFETYPGVSSSLESISVNGDYLTAIERPVWTEGGETKSQSSVVVYEFQDEKIKRFWYYPPQ